MIKIRKMLPADREGILCILKRTDMFTASEIDVAMELIDIFLNNSAQKDYVICIAENGSSKLAGYVCYGPTPATEGTFDLYWIAVDPEMQGKGIGKKLLVFAEEQIAASKGRQVIIETSSRAKYMPTRDFYLKNDYSLEARIRDFYAIGDDRMIFVKKLLG